MASHTLMQAMNFVCVDRLGRFRYRAALPRESRLVMNAAIEALLRPRSIAILGASADFEKLNSVVAVDWLMVFGD